MGSQGLDGRLHHLRVTGQTQVVVGAEVQDLAAAARHAHAGVLLPSDHPLRLPGARLKKLLLLILLLLLSPICTDRDRVHEAIVKVRVLSQFLLTFINLREDLKIGLYYVDSPTNTVQLI